MMGVICLNRADYERASALLQEGLDIATGSGDLATSADILYDMGGVMERRGMNVEALERFQEARDVAIELSDDLALGKALYGLGRANSTLREYDKAIGYKKEALTILERRGDTTMMAKACISIGNDLCSLDRNDEGVIYLERSIELANAVGDLSTMGYALSNLAGYKLTMEDLDGAEGLVERCLPIAAKLNDPLMSSTLYFHKGYIHTGRGQWNEAHTEFERSLAILRGIDMPSRLGQWLMEVAEIYIDNGEVREAAGLLDEAYDIASRICHQKLMEKVKENRERLCV
jgi:tetratricopeptide (TPR) repeat protein